MAARASRSALSTATASQEASASRERFEVAEAEDRADPVPAAQARGIAPSDADVSKEKPRENDPVAPFVALSQPLFMY
jgi:hypothetical protein